MKSKYLSRLMACTIAGSMLFVGCGSTTEETTTEVEATAESEATTQTGSTAYLTRDDITINETIENDADGEHAIEASGEEQSYSNVEVIKTGEADGDEADFYGENAAVFATDGATLNLSEIVVDTNGTHANAVYSYGEGTTVNISDSYITTAGNCSGGLMTTGGGTMNASNLTIETSGNSSAAIRSDRGGGTVTVDGGSYSTSGTGSPAIYSTADITVNDALLTSTASQGVVVEGNNSVTLNNVTLNADNNTKNSDKSDYYQSVMIYQSMSGDADDGVASFTMTDGSLTNENEDIFFITNTVATIDLANVDITNNGDGVFLRAAAAGWGNEGSNGGQADLYATQQTIDGDIIVDDVSALNLYLQTGSRYTGAINSDGQAGDVYVSLTNGATWTLTGDSYITSLTCDADSIDLNGYTLYVNGEEYSEGTASDGEAIELTSPSSGTIDGMPEGGAPGEKPDGEAPDGAPSGDAPSGKPGDGKEPPADGNGNGEKPADKPAGKSNNSSEKSE
ncbi:hypothetical protein SAMN02910384_01194 [Pseudobutyrivibrio sp. ACV-2]|uniref:hypothetical protein n=1 Tax=Pseudobutyrivibrio sp. ACV-2 TaxID=1520801 RepID=UPI000897ADE3|nr:hypothetical protein [Pseudobutyrivibrio sp. ACV-2]SEA28305.1 hypothetical protein SAMN02910384_01194 [Pseudobutyrivibrio sp. ACV-2]